MYSRRREPKAQHQRSWQRSRLPGIKTNRQLHPSLLREGTGSRCRTIPSLKEHFGYTEPFRRFVQRETFSPQANEIPNTAASWLPGDDYFVNFHRGDPFVKVDEGYARLPGSGYEALHPELKDVNPEDYPDIHKLSILADVAPYSREYNTCRQKIGRQAQGNTELEIEYEKILTRVKKTRESVIRMTDRHFTAPVDEIAGTVESASPGGITLKEYPGRRFQFSSVSTSAADMSLTGRRFKVLTDPMTSNHLRGFSCSSQLCLCPARIQYLKQDNQCSTEE